MSYVFNPFTGLLDNINPGSSMSADGDFQVGNPGVTSLDFWGAKGVKYYSLTSQAPAPPPSINWVYGQPIPIGMGLTFTYSLPVPPLQGIRISGGQPIPIGMGLTQTYSEDIN